MNKRLRGWPTFSKVSRMILLLAIIDSYRPMVVPARTMSHISKLTKSQVMYTMKLLKRMGICEGRNGNHGGWRRIKEVTVGELIEKIENRPLTSQISDGCPADIKNYVHYVLNKVGKVKV